LLLLDNIQKLVLIKRWALTGATVSDAREARQLKLGCSDIESSTNALRNLKERPMTRPRILIAVFVLTGLLLAGSSFAQQAPGKAEKPSELSVFKASTVIGRQVMNVQGESLGKIEDLVLDLEEGRIRYAALSYGSILGIGGKLFAVSWENLELHPDGQAFVLDLPTEALKHAPSFDKSNWPQQPNPVWRASVWRDEVVSGRIQEVNPDDATFSLTTETGNTVELQAPTELVCLNRL
jgi:sporulation protein YlmC with PRC-barrel domain